MERRAGICVPLSALWTRQSCGIGEFLDLLPLLSWLHGTGMRVLQLLPLNDSGDDPSPYSAISASALNPLYLSLHALPQVERLGKLREDLENWPQRAGGSIDYQQTKARKTRWLDEYLRQCSSFLLSQPPCQVFLQDHAHWLRPYAAFTWQKLHRPGLPFWEWHISLQAAIDSTPASWFEREGLLQYLCWEQLSQVRAHAESLQMKLLGDLPILCNRDSVDVWANPELFDLSLSAGAPPDHYTPEGQVWGFPLFRWEGHAAEGFRWWKQRLALAEQAYQMLRIDHILGFFRIWAVPLGLPARQGYFLPREQTLWLVHGEAILRELQASTSLEWIGEDLGIPFSGLRECLDALGIPGICVQRWMQDWEDTRDFIEPADYPPLSLACLSTHDSSLTGEWWQEEPEEARRFCHQFKQSYSTPLSSSQRRWLLHWIHRTSSHLIVNLLPEFLACFSDLSPPDLADRRINRPGTVSPLNWSLRLGASVEQIICHQPLQALLSECAALLLSQSKRPPGIQPVDGPHRACAAPPPPRADRAQGAQPVAHCDKDRGAPPHSKDPPHHPK